jgi:hypothetical protein
VPAPTAEQDRLVALLGRATRSMTDALSDTRRAHEKLAELVRIRQHRRLTPDERARYEDLTRADHVSLNQYLAARKWRDAVVRRLREYGLRLDDQPSTA